MSGDTAERDALALLLRLTADFVDEFHDAAAHPDGTVRCDAAAARKFARRIERIASEAAGVLSETHCTPYIPHCMGRAAGSECTCCEARVRIPKISRREAAKRAPSRRTSTGKLLVEVPREVPE